MEPRLTLITLGVDDLTASTAFYTALGFPRRMQAAEGVAFFQVGSIGLSLFPRADLGEDAGVTLTGSAYPRFSLAHNVPTRDEVDQVIKDLVTAGGTVVNPAAEKIWGGYGGYVADPDGFLWEVAWNPGFPLAESDRALQLPE